MEEQRGEGVDGERLRRRGRGVEESRVGDGSDRRRVGERQLRCGGEAEEGVGLVGPVEAARTARVAGGGTVLGAAVVVGGRGGGGGGRGGSGGGHGDTTQGSERESAARARQEVVVVAVAEEHFFDWARQDVPAERDGRMRKVRQVVTAFFFNLMNCTITPVATVLCQNITECGINNFFIMPLEFSMDQHVNRKYEKS